MALFMTIILPLFLCINGLAQSDIYAIARSGTAKEFKTALKKDKTLINRPNENGYRPIVLAAYYNNTAVIEFLIKQKVDLNAGNGGETALLAASYKGFVETVKLLLDGGADPNIADANGKTPLMYATMNQNIEIIKLLLDKNALIMKEDVAGTSAYKMAGLLQNGEIIKLFEQHKQD